MKVKPLCEYDIYILRYIEDTLVMLNEMYGVDYISRDGDGELAVHTKLPEKSRYTGLYLKPDEADIYRLGNLIQGIERSLKFEFPIEWDDNDHGCGVLKIERLIYDIRKAIEEKKNSNNFVYMRLKKRCDSQLRVMHTLVSEYKLIGYEYVTSFYNGGQVAFWTAKPYKDKDGRWTSKGFAKVFENIDGLLFYTDWPVRKEDDSFVHVSEILQAIIKLDEERNGTIFSNHSFRQAVDKTFALESDIQAAIDKYRRELEVAKNG